MRQIGPYIDLEIRILKQYNDSYPVELTVEGGQQFQGEILLADLLPWQLGPSPAVDGQRLFSQLFSDSRLQRAWGQIRGQSSHRRVRLRIDATAPELHAIPWELLRDPNHEPSPQNLAADANTPFSRYLAGQWASGQPIIERPIKMLVAIANPDGLTEYGLSEIDVAQEKANIQRVLDEIRREQLEVSFLEDTVSLPNLAVKLKKGVHILHLISHGTFSRKKEQASLFLADEDNDVRLVKATDFVEMLGRLSEPPQFVYLSSCETAARSPADAFRGLAPMLISAGVPAVLAMQDLIPVKTAQIFAQTFYHHLLDHGQVDLACNEARAAILDSNLPGGSIPVLFSRLPDNLLFSLPPTSETEQTADILPPPFQAPPNLSIFVGRKTMLEELSAEIRQAEENTILGIGGVGGLGKTALAIQLAHHLADLFKDGVLWAQLNTTSPEAALQSFAAAFGQGEALSQQPDLASKAALVRQILASKHVLVVLDDVEDSEQLKWLIPSGRQNVTFVTTRNRKLLTAIGARMLEVNPFSEEEGLALLSRVIGPERVMAEIEAAQQTIKLVGGLPLAISIVAGYLAETDDLTIAEYGELLQDEQSRLESLADWEDTTRNIAASFELSYQRLPASAQSLFARLSVFDGPDFGLPTVAAITEMPLPRVKIELGRLRALSLVEAGFGEREQVFPREYLLPEEDIASQPEGQGRYRLHPLLKVFAGERLGIDAETIRKRQAVYFADLSQQHSRQGYDVLDLEWQNILGALKWAYENRQWPILIRGAQGLTQPHLGVIGFMDARGHWPEARELLTWALEGAEDTSEAAIKGALTANLGAFAFRQTDFDAAESYLQTSLAIFEALPSSPDISLQKAYLFIFLSGLALRTDRQLALDWIDRGMAELGSVDTDIARYESGYMHIQRAGILGRMGSFDLAIQEAETGLALLPPEPSSARVGGLMNLGAIYLAQGKSEESVKYLQEGAEQARSIADLRRLAGFRQNLGVLAKRAGHYDKAREHYEAASNIYQFMGQVSQNGHIHSNLGLIYTRLGDYGRASDLFKRAITVAETHNLPDLEIRANINFAALYLSQGQSDEADILLNRAHQISQHVNDKSLLSEILGLQATVALAYDQPAKGLSLCDEAISIAQEGKHTLEEGLVWRIRGDILSAGQDSGQAEAAYQASLDLLSDQDPYELAKTQLALARHYLSRQPANPNSANDLLRQARTAFEAMAARRDLATTRELLNESA